RKWAFPSRSEPTADVSRLAVWAAKSIDASRLQRGGRDSNAPKETAPSPAIHAESSTAPNEPTAQPAPVKTGDAQPRPAAPVEAEPNLRSLADLEAEALEAQLLGDHDRARAAQARIDARAPKLANVIPIRRTGVTWAR